ncbi:MAG: 4-(cytidine 5'-diphospho)-2-C-methyl-D-erythritol kinase [Rhodospirillales bacterium]|nr:4-(cytidine 5'-diphospho)-2-C-methyl-D-erythritol kinase [Rhodospirillales bacterium]
MTPSPPVRRLFAPAKVNLYLHITGKRADGYHLLDSLMGFVDVGDEITITPAPHFDFAVDGPFAGGFSAEELSTAPHSTNLVVRAVYKLADALNRTPDFKITLTKNLPLTSGMGGGSSDAATAIWGILEHWDTRPQSVPDLTDLLLSLGAELPVCLSCRPALVSGIGETVHPAPPMGEVPVLLINPGKPCSTATIFKNFHGPYHTPVTWPARFEKTNDLISYLARLENSLTDEAVKLVPEISSVLDILTAQEGCVLARMSGAGATCFGLFGTEAETIAAAARIKKIHPEWWIASGLLNRPERY